MAAHVIITMNIKDADKVPEYQKAGGPTVAAHGGEFVARGPAETLSGSGGADRVILIKFADAEAARTWFNSPEYQATADIRRHMADMTFLLVDA